MCIFDVQAIMNINLCLQVSESRPETQSQFDTLIHLPMLPPSIS